MKPWLLDSDTLMVPVRHLGGGICGEKQIQHKKRQYMLVCLLMFVCFFVCLLMYVCLFVCLFCLFVDVCLFVCLFCLFVFLFVCLFVLFCFVCLFVSFLMFVCFFVCLFVCFFVFLFVCLFVFLFCFVLFFVLFCFVFLFVVVPKYEGKIMQSTVLCQSHFDHQNLDLWKCVQISTSPWCYTFLHHWCRAVSCCSS